MKQAITISALCLLGFGTNALAQNDTISFEAPQKLNNQVNSSAEESLPILSQDGKTLYFARTFHNENVGGQESAQDIWSSTKDGDTFGKAEHLKSLNDKRSNVVAGISQDQKRIYVMHQFIGNNQTEPGISVCTMDSESKKWSLPVPVTIPNLLVETTYYSAYVSPYEDFILWSLPVDSLGNNLYVSTSSDKGATWTSPMDLGTVNSLYDEISPYYDTKNDLLFFATNPTGDAMDYDIFYAKKTSDSWTEWSEPVRAEGGINSDMFDAYFFAAEDGTAYFSSNRGDSLSNLYSSEMIITPTETDSLIVVEEEESDPVLIIETVEGTVTDRTLGSLSKEELIAETTKIRFVYFDFDKYVISKKYIEVLDDAAEILDKYPDLYMEINGHTDAVGSDAYNNQLSINRANSAKEFMLINGVEPSKIVVIGHGKTQPYATNFTEDGRAMNRRVELFFKQNN